MERTERLGRYTLLLTADCFPLVGDSLALGRFATVRRRWKVCSTTGRYSTRTCLPRT